MKMCKWCRKPIITGQEAPWTHAFGSYTCAYRPENLAEPADERWELVWASIGLPEIHDSDIENGFAKILEKLVEIRIEVRYDGQRVYQVIRISKEDIQDACAPPIPLVLNKMVEKLDEALDNYQEGKLSNV